MRLIGLNLFSNNSPILLGDEDKFFDKLFFGESLDRWSFKSHFFDWFNVKMVVAFVVIGMIILLSFIVCMSFISFVINFISKFNVIMVLKNT
jgi:hypothetical protein